MELGGLFSRKSNHALAFFGVVCERCFWASDFEVDNFASFFSQVLDSL